MRRMLGTLALATTTVAALAGCGDDGGGAPAPAPTGATSPTPVLVSGTAAGGEVTTRPSLLPDEGSLRLYVEGFREPFSSRLERAARRMPVEPDEQLAAAVVAVGCDVPPGARVTEDAEEHLVIAAEKVPSPRSECFAPITTVALVAVPLSVQ